MVKNMNLPGESESLEERKYTSTEGSINESEVKEKEFLQFLSSMDLKMENLICQKSDLEKSQDDPDFGTAIDGLIKRKKREVEEINKEVSEHIKEYLEPLQDEEKKHVFEVMEKNGFEGFLVDNLEYFGENINRELATEISTKLWKNSDLGAIYIDRGYDQNNVDGVLKFLKNLKKSKFEGLPIYKLAKRIERDNYIVYGCIYSGKIIGVDCEDDGKILQDYKEVGEKLIKDGLKILQKKKIDYYFPIYTLLTSKLDYTLERPKEPVSVEETMKKFEEEFPKIMEELKKDGRAGGEGEITKDGIILLIHEMRKRGIHTKKFILEEDKDSAEEGIEGQEKQEEPKEEHKKSGKFWDKFKRKSKK